MKIHKTVQDKVSDGVPNEILKEVIGAYPEILLEAFNSCLREGRIFEDWKKQRLVLLRKGNKPLGNPKLSIGYDGEASGGVDSTPTSGPFGRGERSLEEPVGIQERQVHCGRYPSCG